MSNSSIFLWKNFFSKNNEKKEILKLLHNCYLFANLSKKELIFLEKIIHFRRYQAQEIVFNQGDVGIGLYIVKSGLIDLYVESHFKESKESNEEKNKTEDSDKTLLQTFKPGDFFGELALFEVNEKRTATAISREETELLGFFKPDLLEIISRNPTTGSSIMLRLSEILSRRLKESLKHTNQLKRKMNLQKIYK